MRPPIDSYTAKSFYDVSLQSFTVFTQGCRAKALCYKLSHYRSRTIKLLYKLLKQISEYFDKDKIKVHNKFGQLELKSVVKKQYQIT